MRRFLLITLTLLIALTGVFSPPALAREPERDISVLIDGLPVIFDVKPVIQNGRTLVPFRALAEALNVKVTWDGTTQTVGAEDGNTLVRLQIGNNTASRNGVAIPWTRRRYSLAGGR